MPQQLIYTSAPRGIVAGRSGYCTVARSATMREALMLQLEKYSYYQHLSLTGGQERPIFCCRIVDIRGARFHVLSRIQDAGLDFTGRTNFVAHHLVFLPEEIRQFATPPVILRDWQGWVASWKKDPQLFDGEDWSELAALNSRAHLPARMWSEVTDDAINGYGLLEARAGASFRIEDQDDGTVLQLIAESLELLEVRDTRRDFRLAAWQQTFTTSMQEQDNPADFRWRCFHRDNPAINRFVTPDCLALSSVRAMRCTAEEIALARSGRQVPRIVVEPQDVRISEGEVVRFNVKAEGVPTPCYQWFLIDRLNTSQALTGQAGSELVISNPTLGVSRYIVKVSNSAGLAQSRVAVLSVEQKLKLAQPRVDARSDEPAKSVVYKIKSEDDIEKQRKRLEAENAEQMFHQRRRRSKCMIVLLIIVIVGGIGASSWKFFFKAAHDEETHGTNAPALHNVAISNVTNAPLNRDALTKAETKQSPSSNNKLPQSLEWPDGWMKVLIGDVLNPNAEFVTRRFDLSGAAKGFTSEGDHLLFVCNTNFGKMFRVTLLNHEPDSLQDLSGIMARESNSTNSPFVFIGASSKKIVEYQRDTGGKLNSSEHGFPSLPQPIYFQFQRTGNQITPSYSFDSKKWFNSTNTIAAEAGKFIGIVICSGTVKFGGMLLDTNLPPVANQPSRNNYK